VGVAVFPDDGLDFETLLRVADQRLLRVKAANAQRGRRDSGTLRLL
jgi:GGDEF domain-containing protein